MGTIFAQSPCCCSGAEREGGHTHTHRETHQHATTLSTKAKRNTQHKRSEPSTRLLPLVPQTARATPEHPSALTRGHSVKQGTDRHRGRPQPPSPSAGLVLAEQHAAVVPPKPKRVGQRHVHASTAPAPPSRWPIMLFVLFMRRLSCGRIDLGGVECVGGRWCGGCRWGYGGGVEGAE